MAFFAAAGCEGHRYRWNTASSIVRTHAVLDTIDKAVVFILTSISEIWVLKQISIAITLPVFQATNCKNMLSHQIRTHPFPANGDSCVSQEWVLWWIDLNKPWWSDIQNPTAWNCTGLKLTAGEYMEQWSSRDVTIAVQGLRLRVDSSCSIAISLFSDPECETERQQPMSDSNLAAIVAGAARG